MVDVATPKTSAPPPSKTVQDYIDELPMWSDGTTLKSTPMTGMQWLIWTLAAFGKFFEGFVVFMGGVTVPLIAREFHLASSKKAWSPPRASPASWSAPCCSAVCGLFRTQADLHRQDDHLRLFLALLILVQTSGPW